MSAKKEINFSEMENKDVPVISGQRVQIVGVIEFNEDEFKEASSELKLKPKEVDKALNKCKNVIENLNKMIADGLDGVVVMETSYENYLIKFDEESEFFSSFYQEVDLKKRVFLEFEKKNVLPQKNNSTQTISMAIFKKKNESITNVIDQIRENSNQALRYREEIVDISKRTSRLRSGMLACEEKENLLFEYLYKEEQTDEKIEKQINKLISSEKIDNLNLVNYNNEDYIVAFTKELQYKSSRCIYNQGRFIIVINLTRERAYAYGSKYYHSNCHPCISGAGEICYGEQSTEFSRMIKRGEVSQFLLRTINFFEEPEYRHPYAQDYDTFFGQELKPVSEIDFNNPEVYVKNLNEFWRVIGNNWDSDVCAKAIETKAGKKIRTTQRLNEEDYNEDEDEDN